MSDCLVGHDPTEMRIRASDGWRYCRLCKNDRERQLRLERLKDPAKLDRTRKRIRDNQRKRRRDPKTRERVLEYDRQRYEDNWTDKRECEKRTHVRRKDNGRYYVTRYKVSLEDAQQALATKPTQCECLVAKVSLSLITTMSYLSFADGCVVSVMSALAC